MNTYILYTLALIVAYVIYYGIMISRDVIAKKKSGANKAEEYNFDDMLNEGVEAQAVIDDGGKFKVVPQSSNQVTPQPEQLIEQTQAAPKPAATATTPASQQPKQKEPDPEFKNKYGNIKERLSYPSPKYEEGTELDIKETFSNASGEQMIEQTTLNILETELDVYAE